jgi:DNA-binding LacI/PurR family transcriptional regulator
MARTRRATSFDVAKLAGVSRTTVSFVFNNVAGANISEATYKRVLDAAKQLNYHPNDAGRKLVSGKSNTIGLVLRQSPGQVFADAFLPQVLLGVEQAATQEGFHVLLRALAFEDSTGYSRLIRENHVDGILLSGPRKDDLELLRLKEEGVPIILMGQLPHSDIPYVDIDAVTAAQMAVQHLINLGHRQIAMITNASLAYVSAQQRYEGYEKALLENGITPTPNLTREGNYTPESGLEAMMELINLPEKPSAVFVASDVVAIGALRAAKKSGLRIPQDLAVVGFDDIPLAGYFDPPLTTVHLPAYALGLAAGERLIKLILGEKLDQDGTLLSPELIIRESSQLGGQ